MLLNKQEQDLRLELQGIASDLRWSAVDLTQIAERLGKAGNKVDAQAVLTTCQMLQTADARLMAYADEVKARVIHRSEG